MATTAKSTERSRDYVLDIASADRRKSNVKLRSNVFPSAGKFRAAFPQQINGAAALKKYLAVIAPHTEPSAAARHHLQPRQQAQLAYELPCSECGAIPEGPVRTPEGIELHFRCPRSECREARTAARTVDLSVEIMNHLSTRFGSTLWAEVMRAINNWAASAGDGIAPSGRTFQRPIRLTRTQFYLYRYETLPRLSAIVNSCLIKALET